MRNDSVIATNLREIKRATVTFERIHKLGLVGGNNIAFIALGKCELDCYLSFNIEARKRLKDGRLRTRNLKGYTIVEIV